MQTGMKDFIKAYCGEVAGESFFVAMAHTASEPHQRDAWRTLARLENRVAARIRSDLKAHGVEVPASETDRKRGQREAEAYAALSWEEALMKMLPELKRYVQEFEAAEGTAPPVLLGLAQFVTAHERALVHFVSLELSKDRTHSLDAVLMLLGHSAQGPGAAD